MYARQLAWLSCTPKGAEKSRRELYTEGSPYLELPVLNEYERLLISYWYEAGAVCQTGMGVAALSWSEITSWADRFFTESAVEWVKSPTNRWMPIATKRQKLLDYELHIIKFLSQEYASEYSQATDSNRKCPKDINLKEVDGLAESTALGEAMIALFGKSEQKSNT